MKHCILKISISFTCTFYGDFNSSTFHHFLFTTWLCTRAKYCFSCLYSFSSLSLSLSLSISFCFSLSAVSSEFADSGELFSKSRCHHSHSWPLTSPQKHTHKHWASCPCLSLLSVVLFIQFPLSIQRWILDVVCFFKVSMCVFAC